MREFPVRPTLGSIRVVCMDVMSSPVSYLHVGYIFVGGLLYCCALEIRLLWYLHDDDEYLQHLDTRRC